MMSQVNIPLFCLLYTGTTPLYGSAIERFSAPKPCYFFSNEMAHKGLNSQKRFTNVLSRPMSLLLNYLNGFNASIWIPWSPVDPKSNQIHKICAKKQVAHFGVPLESETHATYFEVCEHSHCSKS